MGGVCIALYGFIAVSGLKMVQKVDLNDNRNLFTVAAVLVTGVGGMALTFGKVTITAIASALILGILVNVLVNLGNKKKKAVPEEGESPEKAEEDASAVCLAELGKLQDLREAGILTEEEYAAFRERAVEKAVTENVPGEDR